MLGHAPIPAASAMKSRRAIPRVPDAVQREAVHR
jgi:hypothetical protein